MFTVYEPGILDPTPKIVGADDRPPSELTVSTPNPRHRMAGYARFVKSSWSTAVVSPTTLYFHHMNSSVLGLLSELLLEHCTVVSPTTVDFDHVKSSVVG